MTPTYQALTDQQRREVRMYGCTVEQMREAVDESLARRFDSAAMYVISMLSDAQEMNQDLREPGMFDHIVEDQRQLLNRAKWILSEYVVSRC